MSSGPYSAPWTGEGRLQGDIDRLANEVRGKANSYEVSSLDSKLGSLERELRDLSATCDGLRSELSNLQENFRQALEILGQVTTVL
jgi:predicted RNase H-like nuclease (RuvC/YqgF family)